MHRSDRWDRVERVPRTRRMEFMPANRWWTIADAAVLHLHALVDADFARSGAVRGLPVHGALDIVIIVNVERRCGVQIN